MKTTSDLHDAELYCLRHDAAGEIVQCMFRTSEQQDAVLLLSGVTMFRCADFGLQNVVLELVSTAWQDVGLDVLRSQISWLSSTADGEQLSSADELEAVVQEIAVGRLQCVFLVPSWGAQLCATANKVELRFGSGIRAA